MTPKELSTRFSERSRRWHDALDAHAAMVLKHLLESERGDIIQDAIDALAEIKEQA